MAGEIDWRFVEDSSPENRELGEVIRKLEGIHRRDPSLDWKESRKRCAEALTDYLSSSDQSLGLAGRLEGADYEIGGDEHLVVRVDVWHDGRLIIPAGTEVHGIAQKTAACERIGSTRGNGFSFSSMAGNCHPPGSSLIVLTLSKAEATARTKFIGGSPIHFSEFWNIRQSLSSQPSTD